ncbi:hypothetical protein HEP81_00333 [Streptomyces griseofuscus]|uniref:Uncharacterized protein n=1 Tax=Streptomyces griseofuscus TaxID=146922 RepID=A0A7H1PRJ0_9ACTN|nr:hypothetical protein HEP81_00333 [Streptomyces griseofuscus]
MFGEVVEADGVEVDTIRLDVLALFDDGRLALRSR